MLEECLPKLAFVRVAPLKVQFINFDYSKFTFEQFDSLKLISCSVHALKSA